MKYIFLVLACLGIISSTGCIKVKLPTPDPIPQTDEYFSFDANGKHYFYPQELKREYGGDLSVTLGTAQPSGSLGYAMSAYWNDGGVKRGRFDFSLETQGIPDKDTFILDGINNTVGIYHFFASNNNSYSIKPPYIGKIVFTERSSEVLRGTFHLQAVKYTNDTLNYDDILTITNGEFYIILR